MTLNEKFKGIIRFKYIFLIYLVSIVLFLLNAIFNNKLDNDEIRLFFISALFLILLVVFHPKEVSKSINNIVFIIYSISPILIYYFFGIVFSNISINFKFSDIIFYFNLFMVFPKFIHSIISIIKIKNTNKNLLKFRILIAIIFLIMSFILFIIPIDFISIIFMIIFSLMATLDFYLIFK